MKKPNVSPPFKPLVSTAERQRVFGKFEYTPRPDGSIKILGDWANKNIVKVHIPQLEGIEGAPDNGVIYFHKLGAEQLKALFEEWDAEGLIDRVITWAGSFVPRMIRGSKTSLSNHAFGTAFDINAAWNGLGRTPAPVGKEGSVLELVEIAHKHGFYWGGNFSRKDGMHFELAKVMQPVALSEVSVKPLSPDSDLGHSSPADASESVMASVQIEQPPTQTIEPTGSGTQVNVTPTASPVVSSAFDKPIKIAKDNSGKLMNWLMSGSILGTVGGFVQQNATLIIVFFVAAVVVGLSIYFVNRYMKIHEADLKADPTKYSIEFVKEVKPNEQKENPNHPVQTWGI